MPPQHRHLFKMQLIVAIFINSTLRYCLSYLLQTIRLGYLLLTGLFLASELQAAPDPPIMQLDPGQEEQALAGIWHFYEGRFLVSDKLTEGEPQAVMVPGYWSDSGRASRNYGTYHLVVVATQREGLGLHLPDIYSAYRCYVNDRLLASKGQPGSTREQARPFRLVQVVPIPTLQSDTLSISIEVSNYRHSKGGFAEAPVIGQYASLDREQFLSQSFDLFLAGSLLMGFFFFLGMYLFGHHDRRVLYFSLFCICFAYRNVGWGNYVLNELITWIPWELTIRLEYATFYLSGFFFAQYVRLQFPVESPKLLVRLFSRVSLLWAILSVILPAYLFTQINTPYLIFLVAGIVLTGFIFVRAQLNKRQGALYSILSTVGIFVVFAIKTLHYLGAVEEPLLFTMLGQVVFFFFQALIFSEYFSQGWRSAKEKAEAAAEAKTEFLSVMSHEIRTPLNAIIGNAWYLADHQPRPDQQESLQNLQTASDNLLSLINDILDFNKIDSGKIALHPEPIELAPFVKALIDLQKIEATQKSLMLDYQLDPALPASIIADETRLRQVLLNLLNNAIKFTLKGSVSLSISGQQLPGEARWCVRFTVTDTGIGLSAHEQKRVFDSFTQAEAYTSRNFGGTGLGLTISDKLVQLMGGQLQVTSTKGKGATFYFELELPAAQEAAKPILPTVPADNSPVQVLLIEDNAMQALLARHMLERLGARVLVSEPGQLAEQTASYDLVFVDLQASELNTTALLAQLNDQNTGALKVAVTGEGETARIPTGFDYHITQPYQEEALQKLLRQAGAKVLLKKPHGAAPP